MIVGFDLWQRSLGGAAGVLGRSLRIDGSRRTVVAVMPHGFLGLDTDIELWAPMSSVPETTLRYSRDEARLFSTQLLDELRQVPGVDKVALGRNTPLDGGDSATVVKLEGLPVPEDSRYDGIRVYRQAVEPGYFDALGIDLLRGRDFGPQDTADGPRAIIISEALARLSQGKARQDEDPVGQWLLYREQRYEIVGVVRDVRHRSLIAQTGMPEDPDVYFPFRRVPSTNFGVAVRSRLDPEALIGPMRDRLARLEPRAVLYAVRTIDDRIADQVANPRFSTVLLSLFAALALGLSAVGLAGVMGYDVASRQREIGIRMALGARTAGVLRMIVLEGLTVIAAGTATGLVLALALTRFLEKQLYNVSVNDAATFAGMTLLLVAIALVASLVPARRAAAVDPIVSLRHE